LNQNAPLAPLEMLSAPFLSLTHTYFNAQAKAHRIEHGRKGLKIRIFLVGKWGAGVSDDHQLSSLWSISRVFHEMLASFNRTRHK
jgi:hypothetical protein